MSEWENEKDELAELRARIAELDAQKDKIVNAQIDAFVAEDRYDDAIDLFSELSTTALKASPRWELKDVKTETHHWCFSDLAELYRYRVYTNADLWEWFYTLEKGLRPAFVWNISEGKYEQVERVPAEVLSEWKRQVIAGRYASMTYYW